MRRTQRNIARSSPHWTMGTHHIDIITLSLSPPFLSIAHSPHTYTARRATSPLHMRQRENQQQRQMKHAQFNRAHESNTTIRVDINIVCRYRCDSVDCEHLVEQPAQLVQFTTIRIPVRRKYISTQMRNECK